MIRLGVTYVLKPSPSLCMHVWRMAGLSACKFLIVFFCSQLCCVLIVLVVSLAVSSFCVVMNCCGLGTGERAVE